MSKIKLIVIFTVLIDIIGVGIVLPSLPLHVQAFGISPSVITLLFSVYSLFSFLSTPVLGSISDRIGRRPILIVSILSTAIGWFIFAAANSVLWLFVGRIVDGLAGGNISTAQSCLVDLAKDDKERMHNLGIIGAVFGIGFIVGPAIGGLLSSISPNAPFWFVGGLSLINAVLAMFFLPETIKHRNHNPLQLNPFLPLKRAVSNKKLLPTYTAWMLFGLAISCAQSIFTIYFNYVFALSTVTIGIIISLQGTIMALNQGVGLKHFWLKKFKQTDLELYLFLFFGIGYIIMAAPWFPLVAIGLVLSALVQPILRVVVTSQAIGGAEPYRKGEVLGVMASVGSLGMIFGPIISGPVFEAHHSLPFVISSVFLLAAFLVVFINRRRISKIVPVEVPETDLLV